MVRAVQETWTQFLRLVGVAHGDRNQATARIDEAFAEAGAAILDVRFFSGIQTVLTFEAAASRVKLLVEALERAGVVFDEASLAEAARDRGDAAVQGTLAV